MTGADEGNRTPVVSLGNNSNFFRTGGEPPSSAAQFCLIRPFFRTTSARLHAKLRTDQRRLRVGSGRRSIIDSKRKSVRQLADRRHSICSRVCHKRERLCRYRPNSDPGMEAGRMLAGCNQPQVFGPVACLARGVRRSRHKAAGRWLALRFNSRSSTRRLLLPKGKDLLRALPGQGRSRSSVLPNG